MRLHRFVGAGYASVAAAQKKLERVAAAAGTATTLIAVEPTTGRYHPVVIYRDGLALNLPALCGAGITVIN